MEKKEYKPGESGIIKASIKTDHYYGKLTKTIIVTTDSITTPSTRLIFTLDVFAELRPRTTSLRFRDVSVGKVFTKSIDIDNNMGKPLVIKSVKIIKDKMKDKNYNVSVDVVIEKGKEVLKFNLEKTSYDYSFNNVSVPIVLETNSNKMRTLEFYALVRLLKPIEVDPASLFMYATKIGNLKAKRLSVKSNTGKPIKIKEVKSTNPNLVFDVIEVSDFQKHLWVGIKDSAIIGRISGIISIIVESEKKSKVLNVNVRGNIIK